MKNQISYSPEVRERAVRLVFEQQKDHESQWSAIKSIASKQNTGSSQSAMKSGLPRRATTNTKRASEIPIDCLTASSGI